MSYTQQWHLIYVFDAIEIKLSSAKNITNAACTAFHYQSK